MGKASVCVMAWQVSFFARACIRSCRWQGAVVKNKNVADNVFYCPEIVTKIKIEINI